MNLRQMNFLVTLAEELNFTRAAERCNVSQPPFSRAISLLEDEVGARLFERNTHNVALTPAGASMVENARQVLKLMAVSVDQARGIAGGIRGTLSIGFGGSIVYSLLPSLIRRFKNAVPQVNMRYRSMAVGRQIEALRLGDIDIGILRLPIYDELIETKSVYRERLTVALPMGHHLADKDRGISIDLLAQENFISYEASRGFGYHADLRALCRLTGFEPIIAHEAPTTEAVIGIVACGEGVALVPESARRLRMRGVLFQPFCTDGLPDRLTSVEFALAWHKERFSGIVQEFVKRMRTQPARDNR